MTDTDVYRGKSKEGGDLCTLVWPLDIKVGIRENISRVFSLIECSRIVTTSVVASPDGVLRLIVVFEERGCP